jgi:DNA-binding SARP family transcriptional activator
MSVPGCRRAGTRVDATSPAPTSSAQAHVRIHTLGEFVVEIRGRRLYDRDWKGQRTKSLLLALIGEGGYKVPAERLSDLLWPDSDGDQAAQNLKVALHRLRRLGCAPDEAPVNWIHVKHGHVSLARSLCWVDAHAGCN